MASRLYAALIGAATPMVPNKLLPLWNHAAGPKTVFFWAPGEWLSLPSADAARFQLSLRLFSVFKWVSDLKIIFKADRVV